MKPYDPNSKCPKCGFGDVGTQYFAAGEQLWGVGVGAAFSSVARMIRRCRRCAYHWAERPLDEDIPAPGPWAELRKMLEEQAR